ncbi:MAG TPA: LysM peptidoglycan-binding domain-containing protein, partial [Longimicrobiaceae bacterium]
RYVGGAAPAKVASSGTASRADGERYTVRKGDSIWSIARRTRVSVDEIKVANNLTSSRILAGQVIVIPR